MKAILSAEMALQTTCSISSPFCFLAYIFSVFTSLFSTIYFSLDDWPKISSTTEGRIKGRQ